MIEVLKTWKSAVRTASIHGVKHAKMKYRGVYEELFWNEPVMFAEDGVGGTAGTTLFARACADLGWALLQHLHGLDLEYLTLASQNQPNPNKLLPPQKYKPTNQLNPPN